MSIETPPYPTADICLPYSQVDPVHSRWDQTGKSVLGFPGYGSRPPGSPVRWIEGLTS